MVFEVIRWGEGVLVTALLGDIVLRHDIDRLNESAGRLAIDGAVELIDCLPGLHFDRFWNRHELIIAIRTRW
jgi:hypothetical protein